MKYLKEAAEKMPYTTLSGEQFQTWMTVDTKGVIVHMRSDDGLRINTAVTWLALEHSIINPLIEAMRKNAEKIVATRKADA